MTKKKDNLTADDILQSWLNGLTKDDTRYERKYRRENLEKLMRQFNNYGIPFEEAKSYKRKIMLAITTEEGRKNKGKYKGWKDDVLSDFDMAVCGEYVELSKDEATPTHSKSLGVKYGAPVAAVGYFLDRDQAIVDWLIDKYQSDSLPKELVDEAHRVMSPLNLQFLEETFVDR